MINWESERLWEWEVVRMRDCENEKLGDREIVKMPGANERLWEWGNVRMKNEKIIECKN